MDNTSGRMVVFRPSFKGEEIDGSNLFDYSCYAVVDDGRKIAVVYIKNISNELSEKPESSRQYNTEENDHEIGPIAPIECSDPLAVYIVKEGHRMYGPVKDELDKFIAAMEDEIASNRLKVCEHLD